MAEVVPPNTATNDQLWLFFLLVIITLELGRWVLPDTDCAHKILVFLLLAAVLGMNPLYPGPRSRPSAG